MLTLVNRKYAGNDHTTYEAVGLMSLGGHSVLEVRLRQQTLRIGQL